ncbi:homeobox protein PKNOX2 isoform X1 [Rhincodon typus]|uniref:homeobox protein PKNOX2 isoform X1 n=2 Tax=Rhincodon typus TaxID=259920 RepID=UPI002030D01A|nr:homeobox protein PKNOX2 isoform X1 [Rhincodon typus]XP_048471413.1 homeobox protein PKNOX2 isoform X1 [Rhincodon typus]XP_048471414.1 homeobox protein PKNOX2 isoform X1 [Rhincodon typus]XP_048471415.1 homeobox protein PKNOX2 isoform X1 [Rhincodon typus]XP_048471416.1 homeobox protein PKNOX2 isoform X1 [Rhincodon typus]XP_048471417.1 homeobox protein PKNOX2 isoform X1 [Rhincodon typus]XP_048471419.1 homeobox protein PKNOX2 isoform X1 [Rhincodon typus]
MMQHVSPASSLTMMATQSVPPPTYQESQQMTATAQQTTKTQPVHIPSSSAAATPVATVPLDPQAQLESDKRAVYRHPLFPLLALLFEKCEQATQGSECITSASFDVDIENFVHQQEQEHKPFFSDDPEIDSLNSPDSLTTINNAVNSQGIVVPTSALQQGNAAMATQVVTGGTIYQPVTMVTSQGQVVTQAIPQGTIQIQNTQVNLELTSLLQDGEDKKSKTKRGVLPKHATNIMRSWLFQHLVHPYPTEDEKRQIAGQTSLTLLQVNNWFINARRRILQPMLDASNPDPAPKAKKIKSQHRPTQRFWPDSIAAGVLQQQGGNPSNPDSTMTAAMDSLQTLSSDTATLAMQQAMMAGHAGDDSLDGTDEEEIEEEDEDEDDDNGELQTTNVNDLGLDNSDSLD